MTYLPFIVRTHLDLTARGWHLEQLERGAPPWALAAYRRGEDGVLHYLRRQGEVLVLVCSQEEEA
ncbi:MAG: hypothetical protein MUE39_00760 [Gammaproteobacteria bacterium]|jgi:hypothetical protein|nr:hypothetical protein [Gammaproteobacteria bacterium]